METTVVSNTTNFHAYTFTHVRAAPSAGAAMLLLNLDRTLQASVALPHSLASGCHSVEEYHITSTGSAAAGGDAVLNAPGVALNGVTLTMTMAGELPVLNGQVGACDRAVVVGPLSATIVVVINFP